MGATVNPRKMLAGWRLHPHAAGVLLALNLGVPTAAWLPSDWAATRAVLQVAGCFAGGMLLASSGALWQRVEASSDALVMPDRGARVALTGWRQHPQAVRLLLALLVGGVSALAWSPKAWEVLHSAALVVGTFAAGGLAARVAAIWERTTEKVVSHESSPARE